jgi:hypothetical protein
VDKGNDFDKSTNFCIIEGPLAAANKMKGLKMKQINVPFAVDIENAEDVRRLVKEMYPLYGDLDIAKALAGLGVSGVNIARAMFDEKNDPAGVYLASVLISENGANLNFRDTAAALNGVGFTNEDIACILREIGRPRLTPEQIARALRDGLGIDAGEVAVLMKRICNFGIEIVARALHSPYGLGLDTKETIKILASKFCVGTVIDALYSKTGLGLSVCEVVKVLHSPPPNGFGLDAYNITVYLYYVGLDTKTITQALHSKGGLGMDMAEAEKTVGAVKKDYMIDGDVHWQFDNSSKGFLTVSLDSIKNSDGFAAINKRPEEILAALKAYGGGKTKMSAHEVAMALRDKLGCDARQIATALYYTNEFDFRDWEVARVLHDVGYGIDDVAAAMYEHSASITDMANMLYSSKKGLNYDAVSVARTLKNNPGFYDDEKIDPDALWTERQPRDFYVARALYDVTGENLSEVARALCSPEGLGLSVDEATNVLEGALCLNKNTIAEVLEDILHGLG